MGLSIWIDGIELTRSGSIVRMLRVAPECFHLISDPEAFASDLRMRRVGDVVTFGQRVPDSSPKFNLPHEYEQLAALRVTTYDEWLRQVPKDTRKNIHRAVKRGVHLRECQYDDAFVDGIRRIYNECPTRQGKRFWHYGKDFSTVKRENGTFSSRSIYLGAFVGAELVGFVRMVLGDRCANTLQVISMMAHRDKKVPNALIAKAVEVCAERGVEYLQYGVWSSGSLGDFKVRNGFSKIDSPRYYLPISLRGRLALGLNLHRRLVDVLPDRWAETYRQLRSSWYERPPLGAARERQA
jgi:hypothetical protein